MYCDSFLSRAAVTPNASVTNAIGVPAHHDYMLFNAEVGFILKVKHVYDPVQYGQCA